MVWLLAEGELRQHCTVRGLAEGLAALQGTQEKLGLGGGLTAVQPCDSH